MEKTVERDLSMAAGKTDYYSVPLTSQQIPSGYKIVKYSVAVDTINAAVVNCVQQAGMNYYVTLTNRVNAAQNVHATVFVTLEKI